MNIPKARSWKSWQPGFNIFLMSRSELTFAFSLFLWMLWVWLVFFSLLAFIFLAGTQRCFYYRWLGSAEASVVLFSVSVGHKVFCVPFLMLIPHCVPDTIWASRVSHCCPLTLCILESSLEHQASAIGAQLMADNFYTCISPTVCVHPVCPLSVHLAKTSWLRPNPVSRTL